MSTSAAPRFDARRQRRRAAIVAATMALAFAAVAAQIVRLAARGQSLAPPRIAAVELQGRTFVRPDIVDRRGRLIAIDVPQPSLWADPSQVLDVEEAIDKLTAVLPGLDPDELRRLLSDRARRFAWIRRGLRPLEAQRVHELGLPGLAFRPEPKRSYPAGGLAGHVIGTVNIDNKGQSGIERYIDDSVGVEAALGAHRTSQQPVRLSLDLGAQHVLADELKAAMTRYQAKGAAALVMDVATGEIVAAASIPEVDPARAQEALDPARLDLLIGGTFELGSIWKIITIALGLETGVAPLERMIDIRQPLTFGRHTISDLNPQGRPLSVRDVFIFSSNVGSGLIALDVGSERQRAFIGHLGLLGPMRTESGPVAQPQLPASWGRAETVTIAYGHGLAVAPLQFAAGIAGLVNGGYRVTPTFLAQEARAHTANRERIVGEETSRRLRELLRQAVTLPHGTGRRADVTGLEIGGKTGTAEIAGLRGYQEKAVIASFVAISPASRPKLLTLVSLFEPQGTEETQRQITAGRNAAPTAGRILARLAPIIGGIDQP